MVTKAVPEAIEDLRTFEIQLAEAADARKPRVASLLAASALRNIEAIANAPLTPEPRQEFGAVAGRIGRLVRGLAVPKHHPMLDKAAKTLDTYAA